MHDELQHNQGQGLPEEHKRSTECLKKCVQFLLSTAIVEKLCDAPVGIWLP